MFVKESVISFVKSCKKIIFLFIFSVFIIQKTHATFSGLDTDGVEYEGSLINRLTWNPGEKTLTLPQAALHSDSSALDPESYEGLFVHFNLTSSKLTAHEMTDTTEEEINALHVFDAEYYPATVIKNLTHPLEYQVSQYEINGPVQIIGPAHIVIASTHPETPIQKIIIEAPQHHMVFVGRLATNFAEVNLDYYVTEKGKTSIKFK